MSRRFASSIIALVFIAAAAASSPANRAGGQVLVAHEWGTFTSIADRQGQAIPWQPLDGPQDLPCFVERYRLCVKCILSSTVRMETPVIYFYADREMTVSVDVRFRRGLVTEWYPAATVTPENIWLPGALNLKDPAFTSTATWPRVKVMPHSAEIFPTEQDASHYYLARNTEASPIEVGNQREKFLFYRGIGNFQPPVSATVEPDGRIAVKATTDAPLGDLILFENRRGVMAYEVRRADGTTTTFHAPVLEGDATPPTVELERILVARGLYPKEAKAMVDTWRDSWFEEGTRLFYIAPERMIDETLPLKIAPAAQHVVRTFVGRLELITTTTEQEVRTAMAAWDLKTLARYGRFAQPIADQLLWRDQTMNNVKWSALMQPVFNAAAPSSANRCAKQ